MPDKKISDFEIFEAVPDQNTAFVASSGNPQLSTATNVRFPFPLLSEEMIKYIGGGYQIVSGSHTSTYFGAIDPNDPRDGFLYAEGAPSANFDSDSFNIYPDLLCESGISSKGQIHSDSGIFSTSGFFQDDVGIGTTEPSARLEVNSDLQTVALFKSNSTAPNAAAFIAIESPSATSNGRTRIGADVDDLFFSTSNGASDPDSSIERLRITSNGDIGIGIDQPSHRLDIVGGDEILSCRHGKFGETLTVQGNDVITGLSEVYAEIDLASGMSIARDVSLQHEMLDFTDQLYQTGQILLGQKPSMNVTDATISNNLTVGSSLTIGGQRALTVSDLPPVASATTPGLVKVNGGGLTVAADGLISIDTVSAPSFWTSDSRLKENLKSIQNPLDTVLGMKGVTFKWKDNGYNSLSNTEDIGLIAQELERVMPMAVGQQPDGMMGIHYHRLFPVLIESIKELSKKVTNLEQEIKKLK